MAKSENGQEISYAPNLTEAEQYQKCWIYFHHLAESDQEGQKPWVIIPYYPESMADQMQSTFAQTNALARTAPIISYSYSGPRTVTFQIELQREDFNVLNNEFIWNEDLTEPVDSFIRVLQSIALPKYQANVKAVIPPTVTVSVGDDIQIHGVVNGGVNVGYTKPIDFNDIHGEVHYNRINVQFTVTEMDPYDAESVRELGGFRPGYALKDLTGDSGE